MMNQKEAVYQAVTNICTSEDGVFTPSSEQRKSINQVLFEGFRAGKIQYDPAFQAKVDDDGELKAYVSGLQSNWLRKDKRLNGNVQYVAKNPGSRAGSTDASIKAMRLLLAGTQDATEKAEIQLFIDKRISELKPAKAQAVLDVSALPEALRKFAK